MERLEMILRQRQNANTNSGNHGDTHEYDDSDMQQEEEHEEDGTYDNEEDEDDNFQDVDEGHLHNPNPNSSVIDHDGDNMDEAMMVTSNSRFLQDDFDDEADFNDGDEHEFHDLADQSFDFSISQQHIYAPAHTGTMNSTAGAGNNISAISARSIQQSGSTQYPQFTSPSQRRY